jgi:hypothetical protein
MLQFALVAKGREEFDAIRARAAEMGVGVHEGRLLASAKLAPGARAFWFQDPDGHCVEVLEETVS